MCANDKTSLCEYTGDSFRDLTRIARINDKMWAELFLWNLSLIHILWAWVCWAASTPWS